MPGGLRVYLLFSVWLWAHVYRSDLVGLISVYFLSRFKCVKYHERDEWERRQHWEISWRSERVRCLAYWNATVTSVNVITDHAFLFHHLFIYTYIHACIQAHIHICTYINAHNIHYFLYFPHTFFLIFLIKYMYINIHVFYKTSP